MAYSDNPSGSLIDLVRLKAGDTEATPVLTDNAIQVFWIPTMMTCFLLQRKLARP